MDQSNNRQSALGRLLRPVAFSMLAAVVGVGFWQWGQTRSEEDFLRKIRDNGGTYKRGQRIPDWLRSIVLKLSRVDLRRMDPIVAATLGRRLEGTNLDLAPLARMSSLRSLIVEADLTTAEWRLVGSLTNLEELEVRNSNGCFLAEDFEQISRLQNLRTLVLKPAHLDTDGFIHLTKIPRLEVLRIPRVFAYRDQPLPKHPQTGSNPKTKRVRPSADALRNIARLRSLQRLDFAECREIGDEEMLVLTSLLPDGSHPLPNLNELILQHTSITFAGVATIGNLRNLRHLNVAETGMNRSLMMQLLQRQGLKPDIVRTGNNSIIELKR